MWTIFIEQTSTVARVVHDQKGFLSVMLMHVLHYLIIESKLRVPNVIDPCNSASIIEAFGKDRAKSIDLCQKCQHFQD
jgi:hypothetical protein